MPKKPAIKSVRGDNCGAAEGIEITAQQAANILSIAPTAVGLLEKAGWFQRKNDSKLFDLIEFMRGWTRYKEELVKRARQPKSGNRLQDVRATEIELRTARDAGELIEMSVAIELVRSRSEEHTSELQSPMYL